MLLINQTREKGTLVASIKGKISKNIIDVLCRIPLQERLKVKEITLDVAKNMSNDARVSMLSIDHFYVIKLAMQALKHIRVKYRWIAMDKENQSIKYAKEKGRRYIPVTLNESFARKKVDIFKVYC